MKVFFALDVYCRQDIVCEKVPEYRLPAVETKFFATARDRKELSVRINYHLSNVYQRVKCQNSDKYSFFE